MAQRYMSWQGYLSQMCNKSVTSENHSDFSVTDYWLILIFATMLQPIDKPNKSTVEIYARPGII